MFRFRLSSLLIAVTACCAIFAGLRLASELSILKLILWLAAFGAPCAGVIGVVCAGLFAAWRRIPIVEKVAITFGLAIASGVLALWLVGWAIVGYGLVANPFIIFGFDSWEPSTPTYAWMALLAAPTPAILMIVIFFVRNMRWAWQDRHSASNRGLDGLSLADLCEILTSRTAMKTEILPDADAAAPRGAEIIAEAARQAIAARGNFTLAVSGGRAPWQMLRLLAAEPLAWDKIHVLQVDERVAPAGDPARNLTHLQESLLGHASIPPEHIHAMPVEQPDLAAAARAYSDTLRRVAGDPPRIDLAHLGLGPDGHTASLTPGDAALEIRDALVAISGEYQGRRRMTLTYPALNAARAILWLVTGPDKREALARLLRGDPGIPAGRVEQSRATLVADRSAAHDDS